MINSDHKLPSLAEIHSSDEVAFAHNELLKLLNKPCYEPWVKEHPIVKIKVNGHMSPLRYLPIDKVRFLLTRIFGLFWNDEIIHYSTELNSAVVHVRLHYCLPGTDVWMYKDGIGAVGLQTDKGASASDLSLIKSDAFMKAMPSASSFALSNAAEKLGSLFGSLLNKSDAVMYMGLNNITTQKEAPAPPPQVLAPIQQVAHPVQQVTPPVQQVEDLFQSTAPTAPVPMQPQPTTAQPQPAQYPDYSLFNPNLL